ncbi:hypothetical protein TWF694_003805 [Orbilia ellipsospora]|uniref:CHAT domain-containing protein n=1 Tax=Orbilia ellipsospora TaxID=2528407 RepID=A0AAV9WZC7_9PEZI
MLEWLWDAAVSKILAELQFVDTPASDEDWPRVWWIPTGKLTLLPLHAAGYHMNPSSTERALDRVISSYSPSIKALKYARRNSQAEMEFASNKALLVLMDKTPGNPSLKFAKDEVEILKKHSPQFYFKSSARTTIKKGRP